MIKPSILILALSLTLSALTAVEALPPAVSRALSNYEQAANKAKTELATAQERHDAALANARTKVIQELRRAIAATKDAPVQLACWRHILRLDPQDTAARDYFTTRGDLETELRANQELITDLRATSERGRQIQKAWEALGQPERSRVLGDLRSAIANANPNVPVTERITSDGSRVDLSGLTIPALAPFLQLPVRVLILNSARGITDLKPLADLSITELYLAGLQIADLSPLGTLPLEMLDISSNAAVKDLSPLRGRGLTWLNANSCTSLSDLGPLAGMPLRELHIHGSRVTSLAPLAGMPMTVINLSACAQLQSLDGLGGLPLTGLHMNGVIQIKSLEAVLGCPLSEIAWSGSPLKSLEPLAKLSLRRLSISSSAQLKSLAGLERMPLDYLDANNCSQLSDITALAGRPLGELHIENTQVDSLRPLGAVPLRVLNISGTKIADLGELQQMPLSVLHMRNLSSVKHLAPIQKVPLTVLYFAGTPVRDTAILSHMRLLTTCDLKGWSPAK